MPELTIENRRIAYLQQGKGEPVILLHGCGSDARQWKALASALGDRFACYMPDFFGHGRSPDWSGSTPPKLADYARIVSALLDLIFHALVSNLRLRDEIASARTRCPHDDPSAGDEPAAG